MGTSTVAKFPDQTSIGSPQRGTIAQSNAIALSVMNTITTSGAITLGTTKSKVRTTATVAYKIGGVFQTSVGSTDDLWTLGGTNSATAVSPSSWQKYLLLWDSTGASGVAVYEGVQSIVNAASVGWTNINATQPYGALITLLDAGYVIVGVLTVATNSSTTFTPGTTLLDAAGVTATYANGFDATLLPTIGNLSGSIVGTGV